MRLNNIIGMAMCSGIGAPEMAAPWVDWRFASEIEPFPRAVLQERFGYRLPEDHNQGDPLLWGDMTEVTPDLLRSRGIPLPDLIVAGTPCQAFSVAGARKGLADARGNLTLAFVEICHAIVDARPDGKLAILWENVPGVLSDRGNAFGCFLGGLVGALDALPPPGNGSWPSEGMVQGPRARAAWAVLDAQWFGVAQRRRRVFVVVDFGNCVDPAAVLLEPDRLRGDTPPRREAGEASAASVIKGAAIGRKPENGPQYGETLTDGSCYTLTCNEVHAAVAPTLSARTRGGGGLGTDFDCDGGLIAAETASTLNASFGDKQGLENQYVNQGCPLFVAHTLKAEGFDASEDGTGRQNLIPEVAGTMKACRDSGGWTNSADHAAAGYMLPVPVAFDCKGTEVQFSTDGSHPTLRSMGHSNSHQNAGGHAAVAWSIMPQNSGKDYKARTVEVAQPLMAGGPTTGNQGGDYIQDSPWAVRRLTPIETARLQGFPDDHTAITYRGKPAADGPQYKAHGNSMAVPVIRWIMDRMRIGMEDNA